MVKAERTEKPLDRRVVRTRRMLRDALIDLILERGYDAVTVQDITEHADLRRATFYLHYKTKDELLLATVAALFDQVIAQVEASAPPDVLGGKTSPESFRITFVHVADYRQLYRAVLSGQGAALVMRHLHDSLADYILKSLDALPTNDIPLEVLASYVAGAELALLTWWLDHDLPYPPEQMAALAQRLILDGVRAQLGAPSSPAVPNDV